MKRRAFLEKWGLTEGLTGLKINLGLLEGKIARLDILVLN